MSRLSVVVVVVALVAVSRARAFDVNDRSRFRVLLAEQPVLTFEADKLTTSRRTEPLPQLRCVGGGAHGHVEQPQRVTCRNVNVGQTPTAWSCAADAGQHGVELGAITVNCEGYDDRADDYITLGSCALEYTLEFVQGGGRIAEHHRDPRYKFYLNWDPSADAAADADAASSRTAWAIGVLSVLGAVALLGSIFVPVLREKFATKTPKRWV